MLKFWNLVCLHAKNTPPWRGATAADVQYLKNLKPPRSAVPRAGPSAGVPRSVLTSLPISHSVHPASPYCDIAGIAP
jgi:hypothetical protein